MAARTFTYCQTREKEIKILYASMVVGSTGAVGTVKGDLSIVRTGVGAYTITMKDAYDRLMYSSAGFVSATGSGVASVEISTSPATLQASFRAKVYSIQCYDFAGAAADPASGSVMSIVQHVRNTSVSIGND
jgi:hypothetical protein